MQFQPHLIWAAEQLSGDSFFLGVVHHRQPLAFFIFPWGLNIALWLSKHNHAQSLQQRCFSFMLCLAQQINMEEINLGLIELLIPAGDGTWQAFRTYKCFCDLSYENCCKITICPHCGARRLLHAAAAGVPVVPRLCAAPGFVGGLRLLPPHPLLLLLPCLHPLLRGHRGRTCGGAQLPRPLPFGALRVLLWADWMSWVLSGVQRDLPSQLGGPRMNNYVT